MVRNLIIALCATLIFSCSEKDSIQEIDAIYQEPVALGILEQLQKDVKNANSLTGKNTEYLTTCIDDRPEVVISGPISNPSSFVDGSDRLDLDFFTYNNKNYVLIRSEDTLAYGLPDNYDRLHYIKDSSTELGVYLSSGKQTSVSGNWDFLFDIKDLRYLYEIDASYNVIGGKKSLYTINIECDEFEGWYAAKHSEIDWSQGYQGEYDSNDIDSLYIRLNAEGKYVGGGYTYPHHFFLHPQFTESIDTRYINCIWSEVPVGELLPRTNYGSRDDDEDGIQEYYYCEEQKEYEVKGYQFSSNGSFINFAWYPYGINSLQYIGQVNLNKISRAPSQDALEQARIDHVSKTFVERYGNWFELEEEYYANGDIIFNFPKYIYITETDVEAYILEDALLTTYVEIPFTADNTINYPDTHNYGEYHYYFFNSTNCSKYLRFHLDGNINDVEYEVYFHSSTYDSINNNCSSGNTDGFNGNGKYKAISDPNITIN